MQGFKQFILRGNVIDLAVGVVIGAAFGNVVNAMVKDILTPFIAAVIKAPDFSGLAVTLNGSKFMYGDFLNNIITFVIEAAAVYFLVVLPINSLVNRLHREPPVNPTTKKCPECQSEIPINATRCAHCAIPLTA